MTELLVQHINQSFGDKEILHDVSLSVKPNEIVSILGVSGIGKTTLFNIIAGINQPESGNIVFNDEDITGQAGHLGYMLQKDLLLPFRTIMNNVILPDLVKGVKKSAAIARAEPLFEFFGLTDYENKYPHELSGGMKQRAALLRTFLSTKDLTLLDEPFSALDELTKRGIYQWYTDISRQMQNSTLLITHSVDEAITLSDRIYILSGKPATISHEIKITSAKRKQADFELTADFIHYKKEILDILNP
ncbi:ABC transporter ATP-binding protein [Pediococcus pentosaceus]|uniref:ABC transporter ATP-binding protein n=1 Tax=Pediococcus pentosaceus TaxID=1255 RepID=A0AB73HG53_PEDPE|nr:ABC transporter ATP-binding protein [Pediococcus pentosaceus]KAF0467130.1 ATP-binding cassette domain-containing protein [Pediococcus pentosaceus]MBF7115085.1 ABC transporter ATP-binding protein [Pediococcus pentosaceus]MBF7129145.1 ABC transporter ATP-binding protein [Pediococcus pentosaceus]MBF7132450.1 ABC transporter ATP-binding protein [Pediococcus pentosaceus]MBF7138116.1 ABC transporter ATP-binding protein [Pediococcus pentosaceus]